VRAVLATEKPAHTSFHLCVAGPQMRVGVQATVGLDALVSDERVSPAPGEGAALDFDARTTPVPLGSAGSVGERDRLGLETLIG
jgi:hypothetical protein